MLDRETVIRLPHESKVTRVRGKKHVEVKDPRTSVAMLVGGATLTLFFTPHTDWKEGVDPELLEIRIEPNQGTEPFEPWRLIPQLPLFLNYARASLAHSENDINAALHALRTLGTSRRGLGDDFYRLIAESYKALVGEGEKHPVKALAEMQPVDISTASRWIKEARRRGYLEAKDG